MELPKQLLACYKLNKINPYYECLQEVNKSSLPCMNADDSKCFAREC